jgi:PPM family protein phosphatase
MTASTGSVAITSITHQGFVRTGNEDSILVDSWIRSDPFKTPAVHTRPGDEARVAVVVDGMGGHAAGEEASRIVCEHIAVNRGHFFDVDAASAELKRVNDAVFAAMTETTRGMGATVAGISVSAGKVVWFNIGDSRIYFGVGSYLRRISIDDSPPSFVYGDESPTTHIITQSIGGTMEPTPIEPHVGQLSLSSGGVLLMCSDGLSDVVDLDLIEERMAYPGSDSERVSLLLGDALGAGAPDNVSIIVVRAEPGVAG